MLQRFEAGLDYSPGPVIQVIEHAEAVDLPSLLILTARVGGQKHACNLERTTYVRQYALNVWPGRCFR